MIILNSTWTHTPLLGGVLALALAGFISGVFFYQASPQVICYMGQDYAIYINLAFLIGLVVVLVMLGYAVGGY